ncbi:DNA repair protein RecN [Peptococcaceae bacterium CEB3]|nr:DNA repair protein RecN [Peptococcaceae bacterium CEB3]
MLVELHVENFGLIEKIRLNFSLGLTVFTGETGAGKSMLIDALAVLLGGRASAEHIRHGQGRATLEGVFAALPASILSRLEEAGYPAEEGQLFLGREVNSSGRNVCRVQGRTLPLTLYRTLCAGLVDIHGQAEHQSLLRQETQRNLLDALGGREQQELKDEVQKQASVYRSISKRLQELSLSEAERQKRVDMLQFQLDEIDRINPLPGEEEKLTEEKKRLSNAEKILNLAGETYACLYEGSGRGQAAYDLLATARKDLAELARLDGRGAGMADQVDAVYYNLEDLAEQVRAYREDFDFDPGRLEEIGDRLVQLHRLRKYGVSIEEILTLRSGLVKELADLGNLEFQLEEVRSRQKEALQSYLELAGRLSAKRREEADRLERGLTGELSGLGLERSRLEVRFVPRSGVHPEGAEDIEFYFSANPGEPPKPLSKVASGGEMSRLMLALKALLARAEEVGTFVFDEVDSGVGGRTVQKVGEKLSRIAREKQVFCITHSAAVAALAEEHFGIVKEVVNGKTRTLVRLLGQEERVEELARMLGGEGEISRRHAQELWHSGGRQAETKN